MNCVMNGVEFSIYTCLIFYLFGNRGLFLLLAEVCVRVRGMHASKGVIIRIKNEILFLQRMKR